MGGGPYNKLKNENLLIILPIPEPKSILDRLREKFPEMTITFREMMFSGSDAWKTEQELPDDIYKDATILYTLSALPSNPKQDAPDLELIHFFAAGVDNFVDHPVYTDTDIPLTTSNGVHGPQIAEWVILTALVQSHQYNELHDWQKEHKWGKSVDDVHKIRDMVGQRIGILGYGSIGRQAGRVAKAMGMEVIAYTATPKDTDEKKKDDGFIVPGTGDPDGSIPKEWYSGLDKESLHHFLGQDLDMVLVSLPLTNETHHLLGKEEFKILSKRNAFISNIARGQILEQDALIAALRERDLRGAALDVTDPEPLPKDNPLWDMENVTITPHISGLGSSYADRSFLILEGNLEKKANGEKLWNLVDREKGY